MSRVYSLGLEKLNPAALNVSKLKQVSGEEKFDPKWSGWDGLRGVDRIVPFSGQLEMYCHGRQRQPDLLGLPKCTD